MNLFIFIGVDEAEEPGTPREKSLQDRFRTKYHHDYLVYVLDALRYKLFTVEAFKQLIPLWSVNYTKQSH